jgi:competence protein ComEC
VGRGQAFRCDAQGCTARVKGVLLAVANSPVALRDDCAAAGMLVLRFPRPRGCSPPGPVIDVEDLRTSGAHALYVEDGRVRIETVARARGDRPWAPRLPRDAVADPAPDMADDDWPVRGRKGR